MNKFQLQKIDILDSFIFLHCSIDGIKKRISLPFILSNEQIIIEYNENNSFLQFYRFNNLSIENFLLKLITNRLIGNEILVTEDDLPF